MASGAHFQDSPTGRCERIENPCTSAPILEEVSRFKRPPQSLRGRPSYGPDSDRSVPEASGSSGALITALEAMLFPRSKRTGTSW